MARNFYKNAIQVEFGLIIFLLACILIVSGRSARRRNTRERNVQTSTVMMQESFSESRSEQDLPIQTQSAQALQAEIGFASYYDDAFHGRLTSSGEWYDKEDLTAAHRYYPYGTLVRVTNLKNGKSVVVRINDRGPQKRARAIDLSDRAARAIGLVEMGVAQVKIEIIKKRET